MCRLLGRMESAICRRKREDVEQKIHDMLSGMLTRATSEPPSREVIIKNIPSGQLKFVLRFLAERALLAPIFIALYAHS